MTQVQEIDEAALNLAKRAVQTARQQTALPDICITVAHITEGPGEEQPTKNAASEPDLEYMCPPCWEKVQA